METLPRRRDLCVGIEFLDYILRPRLEFARLGVAAMVQVHSAEGVVSREHETDAIVAMFPAGCYGIGEIGPGSGVRAVGSLRPEGGVRHFGRFAVAFLVAPAYP